MYSRNDYRYYLEHRLAESDDYLAHYGVKGMKWKQHKKATSDITRDVIVRDQIERDVIVPDKKVVDKSRRAVSKSTKADQARGEKLTAKARARKNIESAQERGKKETRKWGTYASNGSTELYRRDLGRTMTVITDYKPSRTKKVGTNANSVKTRVKDAARRRRMKSKGKAEVVYLKNQDTGEVYTNKKKK